MFWLITYAHRMPAQTKFFKRIFTFKHRARILQENWSRPTSHRPGTHTKVCNIRESIRDSERYSVPAQSPKPIEASRTYLLRAVLVYQMDQNHLTTAFLQKTPTVVCAYPHKFSYPIELCIICGAIASSITLREPEQHLGEFRALNVESITSMEGKDHRHRRLTTNRVLILSKPADTSFPIPL